MGDRQVEERECVRRQLAVRGLQANSMESPAPPAPDVRVILQDGSREAFEVTQVHPDEMPGQGSVARAVEAQRAKRDPRAIVASWTRMDALPAIRHRVEEKVKKAAGYAVQPSETLSLLLVGSLPKIGAVAATFVFPFF